MSDNGRSASRHWRNQRLTSIALVPLGLWFLVSLLRQPNLDYEIIAGWFEKPFQAFLAALFGAALLWHSMQGIQVVIEDYAGGPSRSIAIAIARVAHIAALLALAFAVYRLAGAGGP